MRGTVTLIFSASLCLALALCANAQHRYARSLQINGENMEYASSFANSNGSFIAGTLQNYNTSSYSTFIMCLDRFGRPRWAKRIVAAHASTGVVSLMSDPSGAGVECLLEVYNNRPDGKWWLEDVIIDTNGVANILHTYLLNTVVSGVHTLDRGMVWAGQVETDAGATQAVVVKIGADGVPQWRRTMLRTSSDHSAQTYFNGVVVEPDGSCVCYGDGLLGENPQGFSAVAMRFGPDGSLRSSWVREPISGSFDLSGGAVLSSGRIALGGTVDAKTSDAAIFLFDSALRPLWARSIDFFASDYVYRLFASSNNELVAIAESDFGSTGSGLDAAVLNVVRLDSSGHIVDASAVGGGSSLLLPWLGAAPQGNGLLVFGRTISAGSVITPTLLTYLDSHERSCYATGISYAQDTIAQRGGYSPVFDTTIDIEIDSMQPFSLIDLGFTDSLLCDSGDEPQDTTSTLRPPLGGFRLYPDPCLRAKQSFYLSAPDSVVGDYVVFIRSAFGATVRQSVRSLLGATMPIRIPVEGLSAGVYTLELFDPSQTTMIWRGSFVLE